MRPPPAARFDPAGCWLRRYEPRDEDAAIALWLRSWQAAYPHVDFAARLGWWRERWRSALVPSAEIVIAESGDSIVGLITVDLATRYLDQIVVAPPQWGTQVGAVLLAEAKRLSPAGLELDVNTDNARAIRFYQKHQFAVTGRGVNPISGMPVHRMSWRPPAPEQRR